MVIDDGHTYRPFMSINDIVEITGVSRQTVHNWIKSGKLPVVRIKRKILIKQKDFKKFVEQHQEV